MADIRFTMLTAVLASQPNWKVVQGSDDDDGTLPWGPPLFGTAAHEIVYLYGGNDFFQDTSASADIVFMDAGNDRVWAGAGNDLVYGGTGHDEVHGEAGNDWVFGEAGDDILFGWAGHDRLFGGDGNDALTGDQIAAGGGNDIINGEAGQDFIRGDAGADRLTGGADGDTFFFDPLLDGTAADTITDFAAAAGAFDPLRHDRLMVSLENLAHAGGLVPTVLKNVTQLDLADAYEGFVYDTSTHGLYIDQGGSGRLIVTLDGEASALAVLDSHVFGITFYGLA
jgi:Ca2+-binding RTX toxin-like protein